MKRREFIRLIGAAALSFPRPGYAQTKPDMPLVGLMLVVKSETTAAKERITALRKRLQEEGFIEGTNYSLAVRFAEGDLNPHFPDEALNSGVLMAIQIPYIIESWRTQRVTQENSQWHKARQSDRRANS